MSKLNNNETKPKKCPEHLGKLDNVKDEASLREDIIYLPGY